MSRSGRSATRVLAGVLVALGFGVTGCGGDDGVGSDAVAGEVVVFAAASLTEAFGELADAFTVTNDEVTVVFNFAASSALVAQIIEGAPADVFASADLGNMDRLTEAGANAGEPVVFADNAAAIVVASGNPLGITGVDDLGSDDLILVMCALQAPCGAYAARIFENAGVEPAPASFEENVRAVLTKVTLGEADAGIVYATDVASAGDQVQGVEIPAELNVAARFPIAVTAEAPNPIAARAFVDFVTSEAGQEILADHGFTAP